MIPADYLDKYILFDKIRIGYVYKAVMPDGIGIFEVKFTERNGFSELKQEHGVEISTKRVQRILSEDEFLEAATAKMKVAVASFTKYCSHKALEDMPCKDVIL